MAKTVGDLERNDVKGALGIYEEAWKTTAGNVSGDLVQTLFMLQDDTAALRKAFEAFHRAHGIE